MANIQVLLLQIILAWASNYYSEKRVFVQKNLIRSRIRTTKSPYNPMRSLGVLRAPMLRNSHVATTQSLEPKARTK